jgi:4-amino-4-deoxy-L-arabinose transferase-like glycosyltransferase
MVNAARYLWIFVLLHVSVWTLAPSFARLNLPLDAIEGTIWGSQLQWGYDKNPFLSAWLTELAVKLEETSGLAIYLFSQLSVAVCFLGVFLLARKMLPALYALLAVLILEGVQYYHLHAIDFSDNALELSMWSLTILFFYNACQKNKIQDWMLTGLFAGLSLMTKYYSALLLFSLFLFLFWNKDSRQLFKKREIYIGLLVFLLIILPHVLWLFSHHFATVYYALQRVDVAEHHKIQHLTFPLQFIIEQGETFLPAFLLFLILYIPSRVLGHKKNFRVPSFDQAFLWFAGLGPFILTILISLITGFKLRAAWGQPLLSLWGILLCLYLQPHLTDKKIKNFFIFLCCAMLIFMMLYCVSQVHSKNISSANFPGKIIARTLTRTWHERTGTRLKYVAGPRWLAGNMAFYTNDHPQVFIDWNTAQSPWIDEGDLKKHGALFVWDLTNTHHRAALTYDAVKARYPTLSPAEIMHFPWYRHSNLPPFEMMVAVLWGENNALPT